MNRINKTVLALIPILALAALPLSAAEEEIEISKVPAKVLAAAKAAHPGFEITEAETDTTPEGVVYELGGKVNGKKQEVKVSAEGKVLEAKDKDKD